MFQKFFLGIVEEFSRIFEEVVCEVLGFFRCEFLGVFDFLLGILQFLFRGFFEFSDLVLRVLAEFCGCFVCFLAFFGEFLLEFGFGVFALLVDLGSEFLDLLFEVLLDGLKGFLAEILTFRRNFLLFGFEFRGHGCGACLCLLHDCLRVGICLFQDDLLLLRGL